MKTVIRHSVFETSSSSQSACAYISPETLKNWKSGFSIDFSRLGEFSSEDFLPDLDAYDASRCLVSPEEVKKLCQAAKKDAEELGWRYSDEGFFVSSGILPYDIMSCGGNEVSVKWAHAGGGITWLKTTPQPDGGIVLSIERYDW